MADITQDIAGQVESSELAGQVESSELEKSETVVTFINHMGHFLQIAGWMLGFHPITTVYFVQELTTEYKTRWTGFEEA